MRHLPQFSRQVWLLSLTSALASSAFLGAVQLLRVLYVLRLGYGPRFVGMLSAAGALGFALSSLPSGALGVRFGARRMMIIGAVVNIAGMALLPLTEGVPESLRDAWPLLVQVISSSGWSMLMVNQVTALMSFTTPRNRRNAYAVKEACAGLGMLLGSFVGGLLPGAFARLLGVSTTDAAPYRYSILAGIALAIGALVPLARVGSVPQVARGPGGARAWPPLAPFALLIGCAFFNNGAVASCKAFASAYMDLEFGLPTALIGTVTSLGQLAAIVGALSGPGLAWRRGSGHMMVVASLALAASLLLMFLMGHWVPASVGLVGTLALSAMWVPAFQVLQMEMADPTWRSLMSGATAVGMSLGFGSVSLGGGYIVTALGYRILFLVGAAMAVASALLMAALFRRAAGSGDTLAPATTGSRGRDGRATAS